MIEPSDLESYQYAVRLVLTNDVITPVRPTATALRSVLTWADRLAKDFEDLLGYRLEATAHHVRLIRRLDLLDGSQRGLFATRSGRPFDRRRLAYLCLVLAAFRRSRTEIDLVDLVSALAPTANDIDGLGFDATITEHKRAVVDVVDWLVARGALRLSDGDAESWARDTDRGDALYDIDHDICSALFRPARPLQFLSSAAGLLESSGDGAAARARRLLVEYPVVYYDQVDEETAAALRSTADDLAAFTGLTVERRAEGVALVDGTGRFTDRRFPGRGGAVPRTAGLLLAKMADVLEEDDAPRLAPPTLAEALANLTARIDSSPAAGLGPRSPLECPFISTTQLTAMMTELFEEFGAASFTEQWRNDPDGLGTAALSLLADLGLTQPIAGGVLVLPAAARYRNIKAAVPRRGDLW
jgi:uncharacterized protein (TIGR02678 family)